MPVGYKHTPEARAKLRAANLGKKHTPETKAKLSVAHRGKKLSPEHREKIGAAHRGMKRTVETRTRISAGLTGKTMPLETRRKISAALLTPDPHPSNSHRYVNRWYPRLGVCDECGKEGKTDYAFLRHPEPYTRNRDDYRELCRSCHSIFDEPHVRRGEQLNRRASCAVTASPPQTGAAT